MMFRWCICLATLGRCSVIFTPGAEVSIGLNGPPFFSLSGFRSQMSRWLGPPPIQSTMHAPVGLAELLGVGLERREELDRGDAERRGGQVPQPVAPGHLTERSRCVGHGIDAPPAGAGRSATSPRCEARRRRTIRPELQWIRTNSLEFSRAQNRSCKT